MKKPRRKPATPRVTRITPNIRIERLKAQMHQSATILEALADIAWTVGREAEASMIKRQTKALRDAANAT